MTGVVNALSGLAGAGARRNGEPAAGCGGCGRDRILDRTRKEAARDARRLHKALGSPMATWKDGKVVWVRPEDINVDDDSEQKSNQPE